MWIVSWSESINISDSLLVFDPLLVNLTGHIYVRYRAAWSKSCSKESIHSLICIVVCAHRCIAWVWNCRGSINSITSWLLQWYWQKERASSFDGSTYNSSLVLKWFHSFPKGAIGYVIIIKIIFKSGCFDLPRISDIALKITESAVSIVTSTKFDLSIDVWNNNWFCSDFLWNLRKLIKRKLPE